MFYRNFVQAMLGKCYLPANDCLSDLRKPCLSMSYFWAWFSETSCKPCSLAMCYLLATDYLYVMNKALLVSMRSGVLDLLCIKSVAATCWTVFASIN